MDILIPTLYKTYANYVNALRMLPLDLDGLIPAQRRVLIVINKLARSKLVKCKKIVGETIGSWHPHGDCYSTIVQMYYQGFINKQGNFGDTVGIFPSKPAAPRYTECKSSKFLNMLLEYIDCVKWDFVETDEKEPVFIPTIFPMVLMGKYFYSGIGVGYKCLSPCYKPQDLYSRLMYLLGKGKKKTIKPYSDCDVLSSNKDLETLLTTGKGTVTFRGKIEKDRNNCKVIVHSVPYGKRIDSMIQKSKDLSKFFSVGDVGYIDHSKNGKTKIIFEITRTRDKYKIYDEFVTALEKFLTANVSFDIVLVDKDWNVVRRSVDNMLLTTYKIYTKVNEVKFLKEKKVLQAEIDDLEALKKIRPHLKSHIGKEDLKSSVEDISKKSKVPTEVIDRLLSKYRIRKLFTISTDTSEQKSKIKDIDDKLKKLEEIVLDRYDSIMKLIKR
jgi:DNA gyrase/topoisomerase IV subunit A